MKTILWLAIAGALAACAVRPGYVEAPIERAWPGYCADLVLDINVDSGVPDDAGVWHYRSTAHLEPCKE